MAFRFRKFPVYQEAKKLHKEIILWTNSLQRSNYYLIDQVQRCSLSIMLNIAEGSSKQTDKDFNRYITIALGSVDETMACLEIAQDLELVSEDKFRYFEAKLTILSNQLGGLSKTLKTNNKAHNVRS